MDCTYIELTTTTESSLFTTEEMIPATVSSTAVSEIFSIQTTTEVPMTFTEISVKTQVTELTTEKPQELTNTTPGLTESSSSPLFSTIISEPATLLTPYDISTLSQGNVTLYSQPSESYPSTRFIDSTTILPIELTTKLENLTTAVSSSTLATSFTGLFTSLEEPSDETPTSTMSETEIDYKTTTSYREVTIFRSTLPITTTSEKTTAISTIISTDTAPFIVTEDILFSTTSRVSPDIALTTSTPTVSDFILFSTTSQVGSETSTLDGKTLTRETTTIPGIESRTDGEVTEQCGTKTPCEEGRSCTISPGTDKVSNNHLH